MKLNQLRDLVAIVQTGSLRSAARHLGVAQSGLTRSIRALEKECGGDLFERDAKGMKLTPIGDLFYQRASAAVSELRKGKEEIAQMRGTAHGSVTVGLSIMPHVGMLPFALRPFYQRFPGVVLKIIEGLYPSMEPGLRNGTVDFYMGVAAQNMPSAGLVSEVLFENTRIVVGRKGHPLALARSLLELADAEWATPSLDLNAAVDLNDLFQRFGLPPPHIRLQAHSAMTVLTALSSSDLLAMLPRQWMDWPLTQNALQLIDIQEQLQAPAIVLVQRADFPLTPAAEHFSDLLRRQGSRNF
jgi:LysR family transcriptional regulator, regulator of abg operon